MAKRRADDSPLLLHAHDSPSKRRQRSLCAAAVGNTHQDTGSLSSSAPEPLSPDSAAHDLPLPGNRCRKRPHHVSTCPEPEVLLNCKTTNCEAMTLQDQITSAQGHNTSDTSCKKRAREDSETETHVHDDDDDEDCAYNSFQYWRLPLPELDLSLLDNVISCSHPEQRSNRQT